MLTQQESNFVSRCQQLSDQMLALRDELRLHIAAYHANDFGTSVTTDDLIEVPTFAHLTQAKVQNSITALDAVVAILGSDSNGQASNLILMRG